MAYRLKIKLTFAIVLAIAQSSSYAIVLLPRYAISFLSNPTPRWTQSNSPVAPELPSPDSDTGTSDGQKSPGGTPYHPPDGQPTPGGTHHHPPDDQRTPEGTNGSAGTSNEQQRLGGTNGSADIPDGQRTPAGTP